MAYEIFHRSLPIVYSTHSFIQIFFNPPVPFFMGNPQLAKFQVSLPLQEFSPRGPAVVKLLEELVSVGIPPFTLYPNYSSNILYHS